MTTRKWIHERAFSQFFGNILVFFALFGTNITSGVTSVCLFISYKQYYQQQSLRYFDGMRYVIWFHTKIAISEECYCCRATCTSASILQTSSLNHYFFVKLWNDSPHIIQILWTGKMKVRNFFIESISMSDRSFCDQFLGIIKQFGDRIAMVSTKISCILIRKHLSTN